MARIVELIDFYALEEEEQSFLLPDDFVDDPELYVLRYGDIKYTHFVQITLADESCLVPLKDGSRLKYTNHRVIYTPAHGSNN
jgi:hypothetical protein